MSIFDKIINDGFVPIGAGLKLQILGCNHFFYSDNQDTSSLKLDQLDL